MKKFLAAMLSLTLMLTAALPAFAVEIHDPAPNSSNVQINTDLSGLPSADGYFTVTIPANFSIAWNDTTQIETLSYKVESHLSRNKRLAVKVVSDKTMATADGTYELGYELSGAGLDFTADVPVISSAQTQKVVLQVPAANWNNAVFEAYTDTVTYQVTVVDAPVAP